MECVDGTDLLTCIPSGGLSEEVRKKEKKKRKRKKEKERSVFSSSFFLF